MTSKRVSVWYDDEGDMLEVMWAFREGCFTPTDDERILTVKQAAPFGWASRNMENSLRRFIDEHGDRA